jgi:hypothetical protein
MKFFQPKAGGRHNLVHVALHNFPGGLFKTSVGITLLAGPFVLNYLSEMGVDSLAERILLNGMIIVLVPATLLFVVTLFRSPNLRRRKEAETASELRTATDGLKAIQVKELKEEEEIIRLEQVVTSDRNARRVKDEKEEERWDLLNERLRMQEETGQHNIDLKEEREVARQELASEERLLVAQHVKDLKDKGEMARKELVSDGLIAQGVKDRKEDDRWNVLNEKLRAQVATGEQNKQETETARKELVSDKLIAQGVKNLKEDERWDVLNETLRVQDTTEEQNKADWESAQQVKNLKEDGRWEQLNEDLRTRQAEASKRSGEMKEEREFLRQKLATGVLKAQRDTREVDDERWIILHERMRIQEERSDEREKEQLKRDEELQRMLHLLLALQKPTP